MTTLVAVRGSAGRTLLIGWLVMGTVDILDAILMTLYRGGSPPRMLQGIASGLLGRASFEGGTRTVLLGLGLHYFIALSVMLTYFLASRRVELLTRRWVPCGILYGLGVWAFMQYVVIPLSLIQQRRGFNLVGLINQLLIHALGVGLLSAWFARQARLQAGREPLSDL
jgi:hypothetical protein